MSGDLWNFYDGEPWLDNPQVYLVNRSARRRKKGKKTMARRRRRGRRAAPRRTYRRRRVHRRRRASVRHNPLRSYRRHARRRRHHRHVRRYRRNPISVAGLNFNQLLTGGAAVIVSPMIEKQLLPLLPATVSGTVYGRWAVKLGAALGTWYVTKATLGRRSSDVVAIALGSTLIADAVDEFFPTLTGAVRAYTPARNLSAYTRRGMGSFGYVMPGQITRGLRGLGPNPNVRIGAGPGSDTVFNPPF